MTKSIDAFYMVKGRGPTNAKHDSEDSAIAEAKRLASQNPGDTFFVMVVTRAFRSVHVEELCVNDPEIPF